MCNEGFCVRFNDLWVMSGSSSQTESLCLLFMTAKECKDYVLIGDEYFLTGPAALSFIETSQKFADRCFNKRIKEGFVYFIRASNGLTKIGKTKNISQRYIALKTSSPDRLEIEGYIVCKDNSKLEQTLHQIFSSKREHGEWFKIDIKSLKEAILKLEKLATDMVEIGADYGKVREVITRMILKQGV
jgi:hypothetical protein